MINVMKNIAEVLLQTSREIGHEVNVGTTKFPQNQNEL
jgi:hypothetical protein